MIVWCDFGLLKKLDNETAYFETLTCRLYTNNHTPVAGDDETDYTEAVFPGYLAVLLDDWQAPFTVTSGLARMIETVRDFTWNLTGASQSIYGYFVTDALGNLIWAERYAAAPFVMSSSQPTFSVLPRMDAQSIP